MHGLAMNIAVVQFPNPGHRKAVLQFFSFNVTVVLNPGVWDTELVV